MRHAACFPVFQANRIYHHQLFHLLRPHQRIAGCQHAAGGVPNNGDAIDAQRFQQRMGIVCQLLEGVLIAFRLSGFAKTDLIGGHHAIAAGGERADGIFPGSGAEVFTVHQHHGTVVGFFRLNIQIRHIKRLVLRGKGEVFHRPGVVKTFQLFAIGGGIGSHGG